MTQPPHTFLPGSLYQGDAATVLESWPDNLVDLVVTSPPYWNAVDYRGDATPWPEYDAYLSAMQRVWQQCARVLRPNGKLCINAPIMPIPQALMKQQTRHLKNIAFDLDAGILSGTDMRRFSVFVWQKQTSKMMFGSYPYPGNLLENNTIEFINVYVKPGKPPKFPTAVKEANRLSRAEWIDLCQQVWFMVPADIRRLEGHPAPFPEKLPARLIKLYTYGQAPGHAGEIVLDPFVGTGTTCAVAQRLGRRFVGIDCNENFLAYAQQRLRSPDPHDVQILVGRGKYPKKEELTRMAARETATIGARAVKKHKRRTYGRAAT